MKIAIMGCGTVGTGCVEIADEFAAVLAKRCYEENVEVKYILDIRDLSDKPFASKVVKDLDVILADPEVGVVVEAMGGTEPAFTFCMKCMNAGKSVVTSNKQLVAEKGEELFDAAGKNNVCFRFGASVCGGIPVIRTLFTGMGADEITSFAGILNGTTNYILTRMIDEKASFDQALKTAQELGYAEKDPTADVEGIDACRKTAILSSIAFGRHIRPEEIHTEGITGVTLEDAAYAENFGAKIKLLGRASKIPEGGINAIVSPVLVKNEMLISGVKGVFNALSVVGVKTGELLLYGQGAGKDATASAVMADVLDCIRDKRFTPVYSWKKGTGKDVSDYLNAETRLYIRGYAKDKTAAVAEIRESFGGVTVLTRENAPDNEIAFVTGKEKEGALREILAGLRDFAPASVIRIFG